MSDPNYKALQDQSARLRELANQKPTAARIAEVEAALLNKHEGIRSLAAQAAAAWGDRNFIEPVKSVLIDSIEREGGFTSFTMVVSNALSELVVAEDEEWLAPMLKKYANIRDYWQLYALWDRHTEFTGEQGPGMLARR